MSQQQYTQTQQAMKPRPPDQITLEMRQNYFADPPVPPKVRVYVFAVLFLAGIFFAHNLYVILVLVACLVPIALRFIKWFRELKRPTMTDQEYDNWTWWYLWDIQEEALRKFRIASTASEAQSNLKTIRGFVVPRDADAHFYRPFFRTKEGADGKFRTSVSRFFTVYMAEHELCMYIRDVNALDAKCIKKDSNHYYEMVASISMDAYGYYLDGQDELKLVSLDYFSVTMTSGHKIGMTTMSRDDKTEQTVAELRQLLGAKKYRQGQQTYYPGAAGNFPNYGGMPGGYPPNPQYPPTTGPYPGYSGLPGNYPPNPPQYPPTTDPYPGYNGYPPTPQYPPTTDPDPGYGDNQGMANGYRGTSPYPPTTGPYPGNTSGPVSAPFPYPPSAPTDPGGTPPFYP